jgi:hypothetical protein
MSDPAPITTAARNPADAERTTKLPRMTRELSLGWRFLSPGWPITRYFFFCSCLSFTAMLLSGILCGLGGRCREVELPLPLCRSSSSWCLRWNCPNRRPGRRSCSLLFARRTRSASGHGLARSARYRRSNWPDILLIRKCLSFPTAYARYWVTIQLRQRRERLFEMRASFRSRRGRELNECCNPSSLASL